MDLKSRQHPMRESSAPALPAPSLLSPFIVLRRQSCSQPQKPFRLRRCGRTSCGGGRGCKCQDSGSVLCVRLGHGGLGNTGLRCPEEVRAHREASSWGQCPNTRDSSDLGPRTQGPGRARHPCPCKSGGQGGPALARLPVRLLPACSAPAEVPGQGGERCEDGGTGCLDKTEGTLQREMQNNQENMPEVTSRAQGTKKESGRNRANSEKPRRKPIP